MLENILLVLAVTIMNYFIQPYVSKKGENLASREDLKELTEIAKSIEHNYVTLAENIRASNLIKSEAVVKYDALKADLLLSFLHEVNDIFLRLQYAPIELLINWRIESNLQDWRTYIKETGALLNSLELTYSKFFMFFDEEHQIPIAATSLYAIVIPIAAEIINLTNEFEPDLFAGRTLLMLKERNEEHIESLKNITNTIHEAAVSFYERTHNCNTDFQDKRSLYVTELRKYYGSIRIE